MAVEIYYPPENLELPDSEPVLFLAGPIQGAPDWQKYASNYFLREPYVLMHSLHIANPRREYLDEKFNYDAQVEWEKAALLKAARNGAIIFWFAAKDPDQPHETGRAYAQTSRVEFGRVMGWLDYNPAISLVVGIEPGYKGSEKYFATCAAEKNLAIYSDLDEVCAAALDSIRKEVTHGAI